MKVYQIYKTFGVYHENGNELIEIPTKFIYTNKELVDKILEKKQFCSDVNVLCDEWIIKEFTLIESEEDLDDNYTEIFTLLERNTLDESEVDE